MNGATVAGELGSQMPLMLPYLVLAGGGLLVMLVDSFVKSLRKDHLSMLTLLTLLGAAVAQGSGHAPVHATTVLGGCWRSTASATTSTCCSWRSPC